MKWFKGGSTWFFWFDQQTRTCDQTFEGFPYSGCPPVSAGQPRPFLVSIMPNHLYMLKTKIFIKKWQSYEQKTICLYLVIYARVWLILAHKLVEINYLRGSVLLLRIKKWSEKLWYFSSHIKFSTSTLVLVIKVTSIDVTCKYKIIKNLSIITLEAENDWFKMAISEEVDWKALKMWRN